MAINKASRYPSRWDTATSAFPLGVPKNRTSASSKDGTYLEKDWIMEYEALLGAMFASMGLTVNGTVDTAIASQHFKAMLGLMSGAAQLYTDSGSANAYVLTPTYNNNAQAPALFDGMTVSFIPANASTAASTVNVAGTGVKNVVLSTDGEAIKADLKAGAKYEIYFDESNDRWVIVNGKLLRENNYNGVEEFTGTNWRAIVYASGTVDLSILASAGASSVITTALPTIGSFTWSDYSDSDGDNMVAMHRGTDPDVNIVGYVSGSNLSLTSNYTSSVDCTVRIRMRLSDYTRY